MTKLEKQVQIAEIALDKLINEFGENVHTNDDINTLWYCFEVFCGDKKYHYPAQMKDCYLTLKLAKYKTTDDTPKWMLTDEYIKSINATNKNHKNTLIKMEKLMVSKFKMDLVKIMENF